ncbi:peptidylprolyl isomerase [Flavobacterium subsaxonicum]|uniref:peptidylprolyl isomerase n=1 Tax=Flavobacterium subsaxonicum WB 4.1-42 = DSM 21790 TaxID=1121898 RepID=A0A0A2MIW2_9FLAO|nr:peptidylprolyl isomerase [Flavobacterium subsaxonicum]KGO92209.1 hypothetical protein Q766_13690 [Flavobacterium subsaxonicum WB 4.1-42 = DSM 21790]
MQTSKIIFILLCLVFLGCKDSKTQAANNPAPSVFTATFETTKGQFDIEVKKEWSPAAADRLYNLIKGGYYDNTLFYRVVPNFVAQFGTTDMQKINAWKKIKVPDEAVRYSNKKGTVTFARMGKESRGFDLFINLRDNPELDTLNFEGVKGYPAFGNVTKGMDVVQKLYSGYGESTMQDVHIFSKPRVFSSTYPELDRIVEAYITSEK